MYKSPVLVPSMDALASRPYPVIIETAGLNVTVLELYPCAVRQRTKGSTLLFSSSTGTPLDMDVFRHRKLRKHLETLGIQQAVSMRSATSTQRF